MPPLKEIPRSALCAWSPSSHQKTLLALGTRESAGSGAPTHLELVKLNFKESSRRAFEVSASLNLQGKPIQCLEWAPSFDESVLPLGYIAGGFDDGLVKIWNPAQFLPADDKTRPAARQDPPAHNHRGGGATSSRAGSAIPTVEEVHGRSLIGAVRYDQPVRCMESNIFRPHLIACGYADGMVNVVNLEDPARPETYEPGAEPIRTHANSAVTSIAWNRNVTHILVATCENGTTAVWNLRQRRASIKIRDPAGRVRPSSVVWLPNQSTQIVVAYDDDTNPSFQMWDLRNPAYPFKEFPGHARGILDVKFSDLDPSLMISAGRDNKVVCWALEDVGGVPSMHAKFSTPEYHDCVRWSSCMPGLIASCSHVEGIHVESVDVHRDPNAKHVPRWFQRPAGLSFGFGGKLATFSEAKGTMLQCDIIPGDDLAFIEEADAFESTLTQGDYLSYCESRINESEDEYECLTWRVVQTLFLPVENRSEALLEQLGFVPQKILQEAEASLGRRLGLAFEIANELPAAGSGTKATGAGNLAGGAGAVQRQKSQDFFDGGGIDADLRDDDLTRPHPLIGGGGGAGSAAGTGGAFGTQHTAAVESMLAQSVDAESFFNQLGAGAGGSDADAGEGVDSDLIDPLQAFSSRGTFPENAPAGKKVGGHVGGGGSSHPTGPTTTGTGGMASTSSAGNNNLTGGGSLSSPERRVEQELQRTGCQESKRFDPLIKNTFLVGQRHAAIELCMEAERWADALLLAASTNDADVWLATQKLYLNSRSSSRFAQMMGCVLLSEWGELVRSADLGKWEEVLAVLASYVLGPEFKDLSRELGLRLERERFDIRAAVVCYVAAGNFEHAAQVWSSLSVSGSKGKSLQRGLQELVEKLAILKKATGYNEANELFNKKVSQYAEVLANSGRLVASMKFLCLVGSEAEDESGSSTHSLRHRIYYAAPDAMAQAGLPPPLHLPFQSVNVRPEIPAATSMAAAPVPPMKQQQRQVPPLQQQQSPYYKQVQQGSLGNKGVSPPPLRAPGPRSSEQTSMSEGGYYRSSPMQTSASMKLPPPPSPGVPPSGVQPPPSPVHHASSFQGSRVAPTPSGAARWSQLQQNAARAAAPAPPRRPTAPALQRPPPPAGGLPTPPPQTGRPPMASSTPGGAYAGGAGIGAPEMISRPPPVMGAVPQQQAPPPPSYDSGPTPGSRTSGIHQQRPPQMPFYPAPATPGGVPSTAMSSSSALPPPPIAGPQGGPGAIQRPPQHASSFAAGSSPAMMQQGGGLGGSGIAPGTLPPSAPYGHGPPFAPPPTGSNPLPMRIPSAAGPTGNPIRSTAPAAGVLNMPPGMPTPWPLPTNSHLQPGSVPTPSQSNSKISSPQGERMEPSEAAYVERSLTEMLRAQTQGDPRRFEEGFAKLSELFQQLRGGTINRENQGTIVQFCRALDNADGASAIHLQAQLVKTCWGKESRNWIFLFKRLAQNLLQ